MQTILTATFGKILLLTAMMLLPAASAYTHTHSSPTITFQPPQLQAQAAATVTTPNMMPVTIPGTDVDTDRGASTRRKRRRYDPYGTPYDDDNNNRRSRAKKWGFQTDFLGGNFKGRLEYLRDEDGDQVDDEDPFHILLMGETFSNPRVNEEYVSVTLSYVLSMPSEDAREHSKFASEQGMSCLGTWTHKECLNLGGQLMSRDIVCRVVPYTEGSSSPWQAKEAEDGEPAPSLEPSSFE